MIDFNTFIRLVFHQIMKYTHKRLDVHWRPQTDLCSPCVLNYDYVVEFDNLVQDSNHLLNFVQRNDPEAKKVYFEDGGSQVNAGLTQNMMKTFSIDVMLKLRS